MKESRNDLLCAQHVSFCYPSGRAVFSHISLRIQRKEIVVLLGSSGCGKSTLLRLLAGLEKKQEGDIRFLNEPLKKPNPRSALIFQQPSLLPWLRVEGNVSYGLNFRQQPSIQSAESQQRVRDALAAVGLAAHSKTWPSQLSGGMAQRVALARALARQPELLFADEPFSALDAITRAEMQRLLVDVVHRWNTAVLLVTHDIDEALMVADRIILMGGNPGAFINCWEIKEPHPRQLYDQHLSQRRNEILQALDDTRSVASQ